MLSSSLDLNNVNIKPLILQGFIPVKENKKIPGQGADANARALEGQIKGIYFQKICSFRRFFDRNQ